MVEFIQPRIKNQNSVLEYKEAKNIQTEGQKKKKGIV